MEERIELPVREVLEARNVARRASGWTLARTAVATSYVALGATLLLSRLLDLGKSLWLDEAVFVEYFVREGPRRILVSGALSHELYGLVDWMTAAVVGESVVAFRLWSAIPFIVGVALVTIWLHRRHDPLAGILFLFLATVSPLLLDISRQARGYGLAFFAMAVLIVAALEASRSGRKRYVVAMCAAGVVGTWTLPQFGIAFLATLAVLLIDRRLRLSVVLGSLVSVAAIVAWYAPHLREVQEASQLEAGSQIHSTWVITAPIDQIVLPALFWIEGVKLESSADWLPLVLLAALVMASSPFVRRRDDSALILCAGPLAVVVALWLANAYAVPRYLSFLLVPLFTLLASGAANILRGIAQRRAAIRASLCLVTIVVLAVHFAVTAPNVIGLTREANEDAADLIMRSTPSKTPVYVLMRSPSGFDFYLDRPFRMLQTRAQTGDVCDSGGPFVYVVQPWSVTSIDVPCLRRPGVQRYRFRQYARGGEISVWLVPAAT
jgi:hypothetical protein